MSLVFMFLQLLLCLVAFSFQIIEEYYIYQQNNNHPLIYSVNSKKTVALSGNPGYETIFDEYGNILQNKKLIVDYDSISAFIVLNSNGLYIIGTSNGFDNNLYAFDDNTLYDTISFTTSQIGSLSLTLFSNNNIFLSYITSDNKLSMSVYHLNSNMKFEHLQSSYIADSSKTSISCIEIINPSVILCVFPVNDMDQILQMNNDLGCQFIKSTTIDQGSSDILLNKIINLQNPYFAICSLKLSLSCIYGEITAESISLNDDNIFAVCPQCSQCTQTFNMAHYEAFDFFVVCNFILDKNEYIRISKMSIDQDMRLYEVLSFDILISNNDSIGNFSIIRFGSQFVALFYNLNNNNIYQPINYPSCENYQMYVNSNKASMPVIIQSKIINQYENNEEAVFEFITLPNEGVLHFLNGTLIEKNINYFQGEVIYVAKTNVKYQKAEYKGKTNKGEGKTCQIEYTIIHCSEGCSECIDEGTSEANKCIGECIDNYYPIIEQSGECRNEDKPPDGYYLDKTKSPFIWNYCYSSCEECYNEEPTIGNNQCIKCKEAHYKVEFTSNCVQTIPLKHYEYVNEDGIKLFRPCYHSCLVCLDGLSMNSHNCLECDTNHYRIENTMDCFLNPLNGYYFDYSTNPPLFKQCSGKCQKCVLNSDQCTECNEGYYMDTIVTNCIKDCGNDEYLEGDNCQSKCSLNFGILMKRCINCKDEEYYNYKGNCVSQIPQKTFISNKQYNIIEDCNQSCLVCLDTSINCLKCEFPFYIQLNKCVDFCDKTKYYEDEFNKQCINCKSLFPSKYKWENENQCIDDLPSQTYFSNSDFNIIKQCHEYCSSCIEEANDINHNCISCLSNMIIHPKIKGYCVKQCNLINSTWYIDENTNEYKCTEEIDCNKDNKNHLINETLECVSDCKSSFLFEYNSICYSKCPYNLIPNKLIMKCFELVKCNSSSITPPNSIVNFYHVKSYIDLIANNYISINQFNFGQLDWFALEDCNVRIFNYDECNYNFVSYFNSNKKETIQSHLEFAYFNLTECKIKLKKAYELQSINDILIIMVDSKQGNNSFHQLDYLAYSLITKDKLNLSYCKEIFNTVYYPINLTQEKLAFASEMKTRGVDLFDPLDPFFNNHCFSYYNTQNKDVIIKDRRNDLFINLTLCEPRCKYIRIHYEKARTDCLCEIKGDFFEETLNNKWISFNKTLTSHNVMICLSNVFNIESFSHNYGSWIFLIFFASSSISAVVFFSKGITPIQLFLDDPCFNRLGNPPKNENKSNKKTNKKQVKKTKPRGNLHQNNESKTEKDLPSAKSIAKLTQGVEISKNESALNNNSELCQIQINDSGKINDQSQHYQTSSQKYTNKHHSQAITENFDDLLFIEAINKDKRAFYSLFFNYSSKLLFGLNLCTNYSIFEPFSLKLASFSLYLSLVLILNIFQYSENYISSRYHSDHELIIDEIIQSCVVGLISTAFNVIITYSLSFRKRFITLRKLKEANVKKYNEHKEKALCKFKGAVGAILVLNIIITGFFWYYVSSFCSVYNQTKIRWLICSGISLCFSLIIQTILAIIVTLSRLISIKYQRRCCYYISQLLF